MEKLNKPTTQLKTNAFFHPDPGNKHKKKNKSSNDIINVINAQITYICDTIERIKKSWELNKLRYNDDINYINILSIKADLLNFLRKVKAEAFKNISKQNLSKENKIFLKNEIKKIYHFSNIILHNESPLNLSIILDILIKNGFETYISQLIKGTPSDKILIFSQNKASLVNKDIIKSNEIGNEIIPYTEKELYEKINKHIELFHNLSQKKYSKGFDIANIHRAIFGIVLTIGECVQQLKLYKKSGIDFLDLCYLYKTYDAHPEINDIEIKRKEINILLNDYFPTELQDLYKTNEKYIQQQNKVDDLYKIWELFFNKTKNNSQINFK